jgi:hypothetical protein
MGRMVRQNIRVCHGVMIALWLRVEGICMVQAWKALVGELDGREIIMISRIVQHEELMRLRWVSELRKGFVKLVKALLGCNVT